MYLYFIGNRHTHLPFIFLHLQDFKSLELAIELALLELTPDASASWNPKFVSLCLWRGLSPKCYEQWLEIGSSWLLSLLASDPPSYSSELLLAPSHQLLVLEFFLQWDSKIPSSEGNFPSTLTNGHNDHQTWEWLWTKLLSTAMSHSFTPLFLSSLLSNTHNQARLGALIPNC